jgi:hypothetical protein
MPSIGLPSAPSFFLDLDAVGIVRADLAQRHRVQHHQQRAMMNGSAMTCSEKKRFSVASPMP